jgi:hypothetical protein
MADSLVLTGVKDVKKHTGTEMLLTRPKRGGDTHSLKEWWKAGSHKCYVECTVFNVTVGGNTCKLVIDSNMSTNLRVDHDGAFGFTFYGSNEVSRAALFTDSYQIIEHYVFPRISGGQVMTVTPAGAASKPGGGSGIQSTTIGTVTVTGDLSPTDGETVTYTAANTGNAGNLNYAWSIDGPSTLVTFNGASVEGVWSGSDEAVVTCVVTSDDAGVTDSPVTGSITVTPA